MKMFNSFYKLSLFILLFAFACKPLSKIESTGPDTVKKPGEEEQISQARETDEELVPDTEVSSGDNPVDKPIVADAFGLCGNLEFDLMENINQSVKRLEGTPYDRALKNDCSGIFHQMLDGMRDLCPNAIFPTITVARSSRSIAGWYAKNGHLTIVRDPASQGDLIKPGTVMFYGHTQHAALYNYQTMTIDTLTAPRVGINHVAIVIEVSRDENNVLQSYIIFHGRNVGKNAGITTSRRTYPFRSGLPVYGNWGEPWLAIAEVLTPKR